MNSMLKVLRRRTQTDQTAAPRSRRSFRLARLALAPTLALSIGLMFAASPAGATVNTTRGGSATTEGICQPTPYQTVEATGTIFAESGYTSQNVGVRVWLYSYAAQKYVRDTGWMVDSARNWGSVWDQTFYVSGATSRYALYIQYSWQRGSTWTPTVGEFVTTYHKVNGWGSQITSTCYA
jgi:hypothetical protein